MLEFEANPQMVCMFWETKYLMADLLQMKHQNRGEESSLKIYDTKW